MKKTLLFLLLFLTAAAAAQQPPVVHPKPGETRLDAPSITVTFLTRKQNYPGGPAATQDVDVLSPKSVNIHPAGYKYYVNSLEGTVFATLAVFLLSVSEIADPCRAVFLGHKSVPDTALCRSHGA